MIMSQVVLVDVSIILCRPTVLPAKIDSDVTFCLKGYKGVTFI